MMTYHELINQWFNRAITEDDYFTKYIFLYIAFTAFLTQRWGGVSDRDKINRVKEDVDAKEYYLRLIEEKEDLHDVLLRLVRELRRRPVRNITRPNDTNWQGRDGVLRDKRDWENLVEFWYRVRNNLFHGHKAPEFARDRRLVEYAYSTLMPFMRNFIDHFLTWDFS